MNTNNSYTANIARDRMQRYMLKAAKVAAADPLAWRERVTRGLRFQQSMSRAQESGTLPESPSLALRGTFSASPVPLDGTGLITPTPTGEAISSAPEHEAPVTHWAESWWLWTAFYVLILVGATVGVFQ